MLSRIITRIAKNTTSRVSNPLQYYSRHISNGFNINDDINDYIPLENIRSPKDNLRLKGKRTKSFAQNILNIGNTTLPSTETQTLPTLLLSNIPLGTTQEEIKEVLKTTVGIYSFTFPYDHTVARIHFKNEEFSSFALENPDLPNILNFKGTTLTLAPLYSTPLHIEDPSYYSRTMILTNVDWSDSNLLIQKALQSVGNIISITREKPLYQSVYITFENEIDIDQLNGSHFQINERTAYLIELSEDNLDYITSIKDIVMENAKSFKTIIVDNISSPYKNSDVLKIFSTFGPCVSEPTPYRLQYKVTFNEHKHALKALKSLNGSFPSIFQIMSQLKSLKLTPIRDKFPMIIRYEIGEVEKQARNSNILSLPNVLQTGLVKLSPYSQVFLFLDKRTFNMFDRTTKTELNSRFIYIYGDLPSNAGESLNFAEYFTKLADFRFISCFPPEKIACISFLDHVFAAKYRENMGHFVSQKIYDPETRNISWSITHKAEPFKKTI